ncbi:MAG: Cof-type HAD-IIB family hydrolase [Bacillota bacterium]|nr:Cof-type HAD-IIB family hydrolase [Bacillota bacterium]
MKETIKLVLVDVDGTLLNSQMIVTEKNKQAIAKLAQKNILFGIATGRTPYAVNHLIHHWGIADSCDLIMGFNGGATLNLKTGELRQYNLIKGEYLAEVRETFKDFNVNYGIYDKETYHCVLDDAGARRVCKNNNLPLIVDDLSYYNDLEVEKMLMMGEPEEIDRAQSFYETKVRTNHYKAVRSTPRLFEFLNPELSKSKGIEEICKHYGFKKENVLTFGDELNDLEMIRDCVGVAMGNANPKIKEIAKYQTLSNDEDGIAYFLEKNIL